MKISRPWYKPALIIVLIWFVVHIAYTITDGLSNNGKNADIAVIPGSKVNEDGTLSERLEKRMQCGLTLYQSGRVKKIIVSGGLGKEGFYEGQKMKDYLLSKQVPDSLIIVDDKGNTTLATVENTLKLKDSLKFESLIVVSHYFHVTRTKKLFRKKGFQNVSSVSPMYFELRDFYSLFREFVAYYFG